MERRELLRVLSGLGAQAILSKYDNTLEEFGRIVPGTASADSRRLTDRPIPSCSSTVYPGERIVLWGEFSAKLLHVVATAPAWRSSPKVIQNLTFLVDKLDASCLYEFNECRPVKLEVIDNNQHRVIWVNKPHVLWLEKVNLSSGEPLRLFGRNLHCATSLDLVNGGTKIPLKMLKSEPYVIETEIPLGQSGNYSLQVDGDYVHDVVIMNNGDDPLNIQTWWAREFNWRTHINIDPAKLEMFPGDSTDVIQNELNSLTSTGGVVQIPSGTFGVRTLLIPPNVVLMGAGSSKTTLKYVGGQQQTNAKMRASQDDKGRVLPGKDPTAILRAEAGPVGVARLGISADDLPPADGYRRNRGVVQAFEIQTDSSKCIFVSEVKVTLPGGSGFLIVANSDVIVQKCDVVVACVGIWVEARSGDGRVAIRDSRIENQQRPAVIMRASNSVFERNNIIGRNKVHSWCSGEHRIADLGPSPKGALYTRHYISENHAEGVFGSPDLNDGEGLNYQMTSRVAYSRVSKADQLSLSDQNQSFTPGQLKGFTIAIVGGAGIGQVRVIVDNSGNELKVDVPWEITPNQSSIYTLDRYIAAYQCIVVNNFVSGVKKRAIDLYCKSYENWIQGNTLVNAGGIFLNATEDFSQHRLDMCYFNVVRSNIIKGQPTDPASAVPQRKLLQTDHGLNWGIRIGHISGGGSPINFSAIAAYANELRGNKIEGPMSDPRNAAIIIGIQTNSPGAAKAMANLIEKNYINGLDITVRLGADVFGTMLVSNVCNGKTCTGEKVQQGPSMLLQKSLFE